MAESRKYKVACIQATPVIFDIEKTVEKAISLVADAAAKGCELIVFPETFIPGYPSGLGFGTVVGSRTEAGRDQFKEYWQNSVEVPGEYTKKLGECAKEHNVFLVIGVTERDLVNGTMYCTILYFGSDGSLLGKHRKLKPTAAERLVWGEGDGSTLATYDTKLGKIGGLICWENYMPMARMAMYNKGVQLYIAPTADSRESWNATMQHIACEGRCYVIGCNQYFTKKDYPEHLQSELAEDRPEILSRGGSVIVSPLGKVLAGPLYDEEGILVAEIDLDEVVRSRMDFDVTGHYSRNDVFDLNIKDQPEIKKV
ncbi:MAG: carbon-nitrogen hydrolase family protein [Cyclobacteriaceae bacterium]|nr:carbon-nitrogen hydrolase family protein [Cyclobacteriaceae bacterium]